MSPYQNFPSQRWSWFLVAALLSRAASYWFKPPIVVTPIEGVLGYAAWSGVLVALASFIVFGLVLARNGHPRANWGVWFGHVVSVGVYVVFSVSLLLYAAQGNGWTGLAPVAILALLHKERAERIGKELNSGR